MSDDEFAVGDRIVIERGEYPGPHAGIYGTVIELCPSNIYAVRVRLDRYICPDWVLYKSDLRRLVGPVDLLASIASLVRAEEQDRHYGTSMRGAIMGPDGRAQLQRDHQAHAEGAATPSCSHV